MLSRGHVVRERPARGYGAGGRRGSWAGIAAAVVVLPLAACSAAPSGSTGRASSGTLPSASASPLSPTPQGPPTSPTPSPTPSPSPSGSECAAELLATLTANERAGQVLMVGVPAGTPARAVRTVTGYQVGGVFLRGRSAIAVSALRPKVDAVQAASRKATGLPVHIAADQEGGAVQTFTGTGFPRLPSALTQGSWSRSRLAAATTASATAMRKAGITLDLAPVADTVAAADAAGNPPIGRYGRQYAHTPDAVAADVATVVTAMQQAGVGATAKHFPGLGRVRVNTDTGTGATDTVTTPADPNLEPFRAAVDAGVRAVMISSAEYPELDPGTIAAFSPAIVTTLLREDLGYTGLAVSDDLGAAAAVAAVPVGRRAVRFVAAGGDMVLTVDAGQSRAMRKALLEQAASSASFRRRLDEAAARVIASKIDAGMIGCPSPSSASVTP